MRRAELLISPHGVPERLFDLGGIEVDGGAATGSMRTADWMRHDDGRPAAGLLGVVLDVIVGQPTLATRPEGTWPVTTELSIDMVRTPEPDGREVLVRGDLGASDAAVALSHGSARDAGGALLATAVARTRYTPGVPDLDAAATRDVSQLAAFVAAQPCLRGALGGELTAEATGDEAGRLRVAPGPALLNAADHVHGGVAVCLADVLANAVWARPDAPVLDTASLRFAYLRPGLATGPIELTARLRHRGRATAVVDVDVVGSDGRLSASGRVTGHAPAG